MTKSLPFRQVHLDFHTSEHITGIGERFDQKQFIAALKEGNVNSGRRGHVLTCNIWLEASLAAMVILRNGWSFASPVDTPA